MVDPYAPTPMYRQLAAILRVRIQAGELPRLALLPSESALTARRRSRCGTADAVSAMTATPRARSPRVAETDEGEKGRAVARLFLFERTARFMTALVADNHRRVAECGLSVEAWQAMTWDEREAWLAANRAAWKRSA
jgi:hypothetical protein